MELQEILTFLDWYKHKKAEGIRLPLHYSFGIGGTFITDIDITNLQLIISGIRRLNVARLVALEAFFQMINEVNDAEFLPPVSRDDVF